MQAYYNPREGIRLGRDLSRQSLPKWEELKRTNAARRRQEMHREYSVLSALSLHLRVRLRQGQVGVGPTPAQEENGEGQRQECGRRRARSKDETEPVSWHHPRGRQAPELRHGFLAGIVQEPTGLVKVALLPLEPPVVLGRAHRILHDRATEDCRRSSGLHDRHRRTLHHHLGNLFRNLRKPPCQLAPPGKGQRLHLFQAPLGGRMARKSRRVASSKLCLSSSS
mmetsp:Transcript_25277/g.52750  ORF Transcript_25277/g.52750 Transcript_25277/m.52750 type:complete len:224 (-) Transcript_25277:7-678(-)